MGVGTDGGLVKVTVTAAELKRDGSPEIRVYDASAHVPMGTVPGPRPAHRVQQPAATANDASSVH